MTKALSKAQRRARKRQQVDLPELAPVPRRATQGKRRMREIEQEPSRAALEARCRQSGVTASDEALRDARAQWRGCNAGRAMASITAEADRPELWDAIQHMRRVQASHDAAIGAPRRHATCLRLLAPQGAFEADATTPPPDTRTDAERMRQAVAAMMQVEGWLGYVEGRAASICKRVVIDDERCPDADALCRALWCIADGTANRALRYRGRD